MKLSWNESEVTDLLTRLNAPAPAPIPTEVSWAMTQAKLGGEEVDRDALEAAVALWYRHVYNRRHLEELPSKSRLNVGPVRKAVAASLPIYRLMAKELLQQKNRREKHTQARAEQAATSAATHITRPVCAAMMKEMSEYGRDINSDSVDHVLAAADQHGGHGEVEAGAMVEALAMWRSMQPVEQDIERIFDHWKTYDDTNNGSLQRREVKAVLTDLNDGIPVSWAETDWTISSADVDGSGSLSDKELRAALQWWYLSVEPKLEHNPIRGCKMTAPWFFAFALGLACAVLVRVVSLEWSDQRTRAWLEASLLGVVWKLIILDPFKVLCCSTLVEPLAALLGGDLFFSVDALIETAEDAIEAQLEVAGDNAGEAAGLGGTAAMMESQRQRELKRAEERAAVMAAGSLGAAKFARKIKANRKHAFEERLEDSGSEANADGVVDVSSGNDEYKRYSARIEERKRRVQHVSSLMEPTVDLSPEEAAKQRADRAERVQRATARIHIQQFQKEERVRQKNLAALLQEHEDHRENDLEILLGQVETEMTRLTKQTRLSNAVARAEIVEKRATRQQGIETAKRRREQEREEERRAASLKMQQELSTAEQTARESQVAPEEEVIEATQRLARYNRMIRASQRFKAREGLLNEDEVARLRATLQREAKEKQSRRMKRSETKPNQLQVIVPSSSTEGQPDKEESTRSPEQVES